MEHRAEDSWSTLHGEVKMRTLYRSDSGSLLSTSFSTFQSVSCRKRGQSGGGLHPGEGRWSFQFELLVGAEELVGVEFVDPLLLGRATAALCQAE